jgi:hypothetical protein
MISESDAPNPMAAGGGSAVDQIDRHLTLRSSGKHHRNTGDTSLVRLRFP